MEFIFSQTVLQNRRVLVLVFILLVYCLTYVYRLVIKLITLQSFLQ